MNPRFIEFWEHEYLEQIYYLLNIDKQKMLDGFNTKEDIRKDWEEFLGKETSDLLQGLKEYFIGYLTNLEFLILHQLDQTCFLKLIMLMYI